MSQKSQVDGEHAEGESQMHDQNQEDQKVISENDVESIWNSEDPLKEMFDLFTTFFNPNHSHDFEQVDDNKIHFLAEFQIYNMIFLKNDLKLGNVETAEVLQILWSLLGLNQDGTNQDESAKAEGNYERALNYNFDIFKSELISRAKQGILTKDQIIQIMTYMKSGYFKHFRLIDFVLRNRQFSTLKTITLFADEPMKVGNLDLAKEEVEEPTPSRNEGEGEADDIDPDRDPLEGLQDRLSNENLTDEERQEIMHKIEQYKQEQEARLQEAS